VQQPVYLTVLALTSMLRVLTGQTVNVGQTSTSRTEPAVSIQIFTVSTIVLFFWCINFAIDFWLMHYYLEHKISAVFKTTLLVCGWVKAVI